MCVFGKPGRHAVKKRQVINMLLDVRVQLTDPLLPSCRNFHGDFITLPMLLNWVGSSFSMTGVDLGHLVLRALACHRRCQQGMDRRP